MISALRTTIFPSEDAAMVVLKAEGIKKSFGTETIISGVSLELHKGELVSLLGLSGSGKTTLFNVLAGLSVPDEGRVWLEGTEITGKPGKVSYLLIAGTPKREARERAASHFAQFGLEGTENKYPAQLSGGMKQRAALLRTYLFSEKVALLDEPFSALDMLTKSAVHQWYLGIMEQIQLSTLFVTHDIDEAILLSDRIYLMTGKPGRITDEIVIDEPKPRRKDFNLSGEFLAYKREILARLGGGPRLSET